MSKHCRIGGKKMKDMNEILKKLNEISSESAITREELLELLPKEDASSLESVKTQATGDPFLGCSYGRVTLPACFTVPQGHYPAANTKITFCLDNLTCCVHQTTITVPSPCGGPNIPVTVYGLSLVGCIPWIANASSIIGDCTSATPISVSYNNTLCVNKIVGYYGTEAEARAACGSINCSNVTVRLEVYGGNTATCDNAPTIDFFAYFSTTIGNCP